MMGLTMLKRTVIAGLPLLLLACGGSDDDNNNDGGNDSPGGDDTVTMVSYEVSILNTTNAQPLSPPAVIIHDDSYSGWDIGAAASSGLENLAESGSPTEFVEDADVESSVASSEVVLPGASVSFDIEVEEDAALQLTVATMLVNTNDAFTGTTGWEIAGLAVGEEMSLLAPIYDAGTEANSESAETIPGPAAGGEGYNAERDDFDRVSRHPGVVTSDDGFAGSALTQAHRFDNGAMLVKVRRVE